MKVLCAWCNPPKILKEIEPLEDARATYGICEFHKNEVLAELDEIKISQMALPC